MDMERDDLWDREADYSDIDAPEAWSDDRWADATEL